MHLQELPQYVAIDIQEALEERFMESEAMYVRFLRKLLNLQSLMTANQLLCSTAFSLNLSLLSSSASTSSTVVRTN